MTDDERLQRDGERIAFLETLHARDGGGLVILRDSASGRGFRLHRTTAANTPSGMQAGLTVRDAIDAAMRRVDELGLDKGLRP